MSPDRAGRLAPVIQDTGSGGRVAITSTNLEYWNAYIFAFVEMAYKGPRVPGTIGPHEFDRWIQGDMAHPLFVIERGETKTVLKLTGAWAETAAIPSVAEVAGPLLGGASTDEILIDGRDVGSWGGVLPAFLFGLVDRCRAANVPVRFQAMPEGVERLIDIPPLPAARIPPAPRLDFVHRVGHWGHDVMASVHGVAETLGDVVLGLLRAMTPRGKVRMLDVLVQVREAGASAFAIVVFVNLLVGGILAFVGVVQLQLFGAQIFLADLVGIAMAREMAAIMTAIVMAGRTGAAYAAHLATMQGNEEIDALQTLGVSPVEHLVVPRVIGLVVMMPLLYVYACAVGIIGGMLVGVATSDLTVLAYMERTQDAIATRHFYIGALKSVLFGALIAIGSCHIGLRAGRSAADVGRATTSAVVTGIIGVILLDAVFALCTNALGI